MSMVTGTLPSTTQTFTIPYPEGVHRDNILQFRGMTLRSNTGIWYPWLWAGAFRTNTNWLVHTFLTSNGVVVTNTGVNTYSHSYKLYFISSQ